VVIAVEVEELLLVVAAVAVVGSVEVIVVSGVCGGCCK